MINKYLPPFVKYHIQRHRLFVNYTLIGLSGVTIDYLVYAFTSEILGWNILLANFLGISCGIINNFCLNALFNFKVKDHLLVRFGFFYGIGFLGMILSQALLIIFHYMFSIESLIAKLLTLPVVLVFQFFLNKFISFGDIASRKLSVKKIIHHWPLYIITMFYAFCSLVFIAYMPANHRVNDVRGGPDETVHYVFNVEFIMNNKRLPVAGVDDLETYHACRNNPIGAVPCVYSYNIYPAPSYILSAMSAGLFGSTGLISPQTAARFPSLFFGVVFVVFSYLSVYAITKRRLFAGVLAASTSLIPQVIFTNSYVNLDAHSLAISSVVGFTIVKFMQAPRSRTWQILSAISLFGLLPVSKYNYAVLGLGALILLGYTMHRQKFTWREVRLYALYAAVSFLALASFWYIRNIILYHDPLGQNFVLSNMANYHTLGRALPLSLHSIFMLINLDFFNILFRSFFLGFGLMNYFLEEYKYIFVQGVLFIGASVVFCFLYSGAIAKRTLVQLRLATLLYIFVGSGTLATIAYNSLKYDFQPQGRYMFPILIPTVLLLAYYIKKDNRFNFLPFILLGTTLFIFINGFVMFVKIYLGPFE